MGKWVGFDLDKTLAVYNPGDYTANGMTYIGPPIAKTIQKVRLYLGTNWEVRIFTARAADPGEGVIEAIENWCLEHIGQKLKVTCIKDRDCELIYDDRAIGMVPNKGITQVEESAKKMHEQFKELVEQMHEIFV